MSEVDEKKVEVKEEDTKVITWSEIRKRLSNSEYVRFVEHVEGKRRFKGLELPKGGVLKEDYQELRKEAMMRR